ncbi:MAG: acyl-CoA dehydrogenase [Candidatus Aminicenantes bacterium]|nr:acyl-CoA dehydrogenase [Candidatus Aminicenantes bacterium]NIM82191.1 acyl-CoA dehydrogenase [Candidatus Aminicenantes bacterium]NIN21593.1 acyl-CoA dehydrogenase [Candidatus Aminicenantes bacterium]NIN45402.1 acyl-CoA dehydrogenase [Candidatus Aminicenantes bacterium]NIN88223.1 acyl-CoA dehydrogenase [Candidatus Aminicenantes bacterium]
MLNNPLLTEEQKTRYRGFCEFVQEHVEPHADQWDKSQGVPREVIGLCSEAGFVGGIFPEEFSGGGWDAVTFGLLNEAIGAASSSLCALFTVQTMVGTILAKWGTPDQQNKYLAPMAKGDMIASFAMTEPKVGSDIQAVETTFTPRGNGYLLSGSKKWITYSAMADIFLVFGKDKEDKSMACIVPSDAPGVEVIPLKDMLGFRGAHLSRIKLNDVEIPAGDLVGKPGLVMSYVAPYGLHYGRMSTAWSSAGLLRACLETGAAYASERRAFGRPIMDHGMIRQIVTDMGVDLEAARHLCLGASMADDSHSPGAVEKTLIAKYYATRAAVRAAADTVQIMGAAGCHEENPAARYYRNAKIMEIIEGTSQVHQEILGKSFCKKFRKR